MRCVVVDNDDGNVDLAAHNRLSHHSCPDNAACVGNCTSAHTTPMRASKDSSNSYRRRYIARFLDGISSRDLSGGVRFSTKKSTLSLTPPRSIQMSS